MNTLYVLYGTVSTRLGICGDSSIPANFGAVSNFMSFLCCENDISVEACKSVDC